jgi:hypothetical protein
MLRFLAASKLVNTKDLDLPETSPYRLGWRAPCSCRSSAAYDPASTLVTRARARMQADRDSDGHLDRTATGHERQIEDDVADDGLGRNA